MWLVNLLVKMCNWYHSNDEIYESDLYQRQRAQATLDYYTHVGDPTSA